MDSKWLISNTRSKTMSKRITPAKSAAAKRAAFAGQRQQFAQQRTNAYGPTISQKRCGCSLARACRRLELRRAN